jgi:capsular polysaccharide transport system permease protein
MNHSNISVPDTTLPSVSLLISLKTQGRIIGALLMREILTRYGRHNIGFMWLFIEPMMFTSGILILWTVLGLHKTALPIVPFTLTGYASVLIWRNTIGRCGNAIEPNRSLMHHRNVRTIDLFFARIVLEIIGASMSFLILAIILSIVGFVPIPDNLFKTLSGWILLAWFSAGMALIIGSLCVMSEIADRVWHVVSYLLLPFSGAFYMVNWMPYKLQNLILWMPIVNCVELIREGILGESIYAKYDIPYTIIFNLASMFVGLLLIRIAAQRVEVA